MKESAPDVSKLDFDLRRAGRIPPLGKRRTAAGQTWKDDADGGVANPRGQEVQHSLSIVQRIVALYRKRAGTTPPRRECLRLIDGRGTEEVRNLLSMLTPPWRDHAIACVYAILLPRAKRRRLGVYFTPPHLVTHLVRRMQLFGLELSRHRLRDPAAGGAAFLVPLAREMVSIWGSQGVGAAASVERLRSRLVGQEIEPGLAAIANALLRRMLRTEFGMKSRTVRRLSLVGVGDSLRPGHAGAVEHEVGNPPYLRVEANGHQRWKAIFSDIASGRLNLYAMFVRRALDNLPPGGLVGYVVPASFLGGPEFTAFRRRVLQLAEVMVVDIVEKREDVFLDAIQDASFLVLRRRAAPLQKPHTSTASSGVLRHNGQFVDRGRATLPTDGSAWSLPGRPSTTRTSTLADYGYRGTVGYLVANRQPHLLFKRAARDRLPLVWAKCVTPDGRFDFERGQNSKKAGGRAFVRVSKAAPYAVRVPCVLVQRTSRRLTAAPVLQAFLRTHKGIVGENHVIILIPFRADAVSPPYLASVLNGEQANAALARVSGSASISVRLLESIELPCPTRQMNKRQ